MKCFLFIRPAVYVQWCPKLRKAEIRDVFIIGTAGREFFEHDKWQIFAARQKLAQSICIYTYIILATDLGLQAVVHQHVLPQRILSPPNS